jgi:hypothetical protein
MTGSAKQSRGRKEWIASFALLLAMTATENDREELDWRPLTCAA